MMRSLWTAASGMMAQQTSVDTISNNLANLSRTMVSVSDATSKKEGLIDRLKM